MLCTGIDEQRTRVKINEKLCVCSNRTKIIIIIKNINEMKKLKSQLVIHKIRINVNAAGNYVF